MVVRPPGSCALLPRPLTDHSTRDPLILHLLGPPTKAQLVALSLIRASLLRVRHHGAPLRLGIGAGIGPGGGPIGPIPGSPIAPGGGPPAPSAASRAGSGAG